MELKHLDIVKWRNPLNKIEALDLMMVEDTSGNVVEVRHLRDGCTGRERADALMLIGRAAPADTDAELLKKFNRFLKRF